MSVTVTLLGTGTSTGMPIIGCDCEACRSSDRRDHRDRPGAMLRYDVDGRQRTVLIDTPIELRLQMIRHRVRRVDGVVYTHNHADHVFGLDDLRRFNAVMQRPIDMYGEPNVVAWIRKAFDYIFDPQQNVNQSFVPILELREIEAGKAFALAGRDWLPLRLAHGRLPILGFRVGRFAYCTDCSAIPAESMKLLEGLDVLVLDALRYRPHPTHLTVEQALAVIEQLRPRRAYLTHIAHDIIHATLAAKLPEDVFLAYDGLTIKVEP